MPFSLRRAILSLQDPCVNVLHAADSGSKCLRCFISSSLSNPHLNLNFTDTQQIMHIIYCTLLIAQVTVRY